MLFVSLPWVGFLQMPHGDMCFVSATNVNDCYSSNLSLFCASSDATKLDTWSFSAQEYSEFGGKIFQNWTGLEGILIINNDKIILLIKFVFGGCSTNRLWVRTDFKRIILLI